MYDNMLFFDMNEQNKEKQISCLYLYQIFMLIMPQSNLIAERATKLLYEIVNSQFIKPLNEDELLLSTEIQDYIEMISSFGNTLILIERHGIFSQLLDVILAN